MAERTITTGTGTDGAAPGVTEQNPKRRIGRNKRADGEVIEVKSSASVESKAGIPISPNDRRKTKFDKASANKRVKEKIEKLDGKVPTSVGNPGFKPPAPIPFESTLAFAFRSSGGKITAINGARLVDDERFKKIVWAYDEATQFDKDNVTLETLCEAAEVSPDEFLGSVISALWRRSIDIGKLTAIAAHPKIVEATIDAAQGQWGNADRRFLLEHAGFLPTPKGQTINVGVGIDARSQNLQVSAEQATKGLPSFEDDGRALNTAIRTELKQIEAAEVINTKEKVMEAEFVDVPSK